jgi:hypothetical protein
MPDTPTLDDDFSQRVVIVYHHTLHRDLLTKVFAEAGISVVAAIPVDQLRPNWLQDRVPDAIILDDVNDSTLGVLNQAILSDPLLVCNIKVIAVGSGYLSTLVYHKEVLHGAGIDDLIEQVRNRPA